MGGSLANKLKFAAGKPTGRQTSSSQPASDRVSACGGREGDQSRALGESTNDDERTKNKGDLVTRGVCWPNN